MFKHKTTVIGILILALILAGCGGTATPEESSSTTEESGSTDTTTTTETTETAPETSTTAGEKVKVVIFVGMGTGTDPDQVAGQNALAEKYNASHENTEIEFLIVPHDESSERYLAMVAGDNAPQLVGPNGVSTVAQFFDTWADVAPLIDAENLDTSDFYGPAVELNQYPTKNTGLPLGLYPSFIFYNKDMFDAAGLDYPPSDYGDSSWNMDKLREYAMLLTLDANGNNATSADFDPENIIQYGFDDSWTDSRGFLTRFGAENVGRPTNEDYKTAVVNSPEWLFGLDWLNKGIWTDHFIPNGEVQQARDAAGVDPFGGNAVAMFYSHTWFMSEGLNELPFDYDLAPAPLNQNGDRTSRIHADNFTIPETAVNKEQAWEVMKWLTDPEQIIDVCIIYGCLPARKSVEADFLAALQGKYPNITHEVIFQAIDYLDNPNHESYVPEWGKVNDVLNNNIGAVYVEQIDAEAVLNQTNDEIQAILDEYWAGQ